jgi:formate-dependent nitrite reductase membrane component NrfD
VTPKLRDDGRNINLKQGRLSGEAASQKPLSTKHDAALHSEAFAQVPSFQYGGDSPTYYDYPVLKQPVWIWSIPLYFYVGGVAGVAATFGAAAQIAAPDKMRSLVVKARWIATIGGAASAVLLIYDLGRPMRFLNMLRVFRVRSPMSMGSWILTGFSTFAGGAAVLPRGPRFLRPLADIFGILAGVLGLGLSGYTGVLISQTAVPVWHRSYRTTPILFLASGAAAAASVFEFVEMNKFERSAVERFGLMGKTLELAASIMLELDASRIERVGRPLKQGLSGFLWQSGKVLTVASAVLSLLPGNSRPKRVTAAVLGTAASLCVRFGLFHAGKSSAMDPRATFEGQRITGAERARPEIESGPQLEPVAMRE